MKAELKPVENRFSFDALSQDAVPHAWPSVYELLEPAVRLTNGRWDMASLLFSLCLGNQKLWVVRKNNEIVAALTTQISEYPLCRMLTLQYLGGNGIDEWRDELICELELHAQSYGCKGIEATARKGFVPFLKESGFTHEQAMILKTL